METQGKVGAGGKLANFSVMGLTGVGLGLGVGVGLAAGVVGVGFGAGGGVVGDGVAFLAQPTAISRTTTINAIITIKLDVLLI